MRKRIILIVFIIIFINNCLRSETAVSFWESGLREKNGIRCNLSVEAGGINWSEKARFLGFGLKGEINLTLSPYKNLSNIVKLSYGHNSMSWGRSRKDPTSTGIEEESWIKQLKFYDEIRIKNVGIFLGHRNIEGYNYSDYDWWSDYTSNIAWDGRYADYYWFEEYKLKLRGMEYGLSIYIPRIRLALFSQHNILLNHIVQLSYMPIDLQVSKQWFLFLNYYAIPEKRGLFLYVELGASSIKKMYDLHLGIGYRI